MPEPQLADYPEAIPLRRVPPGWRTAAILLGLGFLGLGVAVVFMGVSLIRLAAQVSVPPPFPVAGGPGQGTPISEDDPDPTTNRRDLPYPTTEDLHHSVDAPAVPAVPTARERFLQLGKEVWKTPREYAYLPDMVVSPDGKQQAFFFGSNLIVGSLSSPQVIDLEAPSESNAAPGNKPPAAALPRPDLHPAGLPSWSADSKFVYFANAGGRMFRLKTEDLSLEPLGRGRSPVALPNEAKEMVYLRPRPVARVDLDSVAPVEIVAGDSEGKNARVIVPAGAIAWKSLAISPDGKQLAAVGTTERSGKGEPLARVYLVPLAGGPPEAVTPLAHDYGVISWTPDGKSLLYSRSQDPAPPDTQDGPSGDTVDLFQWDIPGKSETRLTRGGGFSSPVVTPAGDLYYLAIQSVPGQSWVRRLRRVPLADARTFAADNPFLPARTPVAWAELFARVCTEAAVSPTITTGQLTQEQLTRLDEVFRQQMKAQFKREVPDNASGLDQFKYELMRQSFPQEARPAVCLVLGAVRGEYLRRHQGATWQLSGKETVQAHAYDAVALSAENGFAQALNPFFWRTTLKESVHHAQGRRLWLVDDAETGKACVQKSVDADLERGRDLLTQGKNEEAERLLMEMADREPNRSNTELAYQTGKLLFEYKRLSAVRQLLERPVLRSVDSAPLYNLLGLAQLDAEPRRSLDTFKKSLRCDLHFIPAYLNLARAYEKLGERSAARACLRRAVDLAPDGSQTADALEQLGRLAQEER